MKKAAGIASVYIAAIIGAGFASGQEILTFFSSFGRRGIVGILISGILFGLVAALVLVRCHISKTNSFDAYISSISGKNIAFICNTISTLFMLGGFFIMAAGSGALMQQQLNINKIWGVLLMLFLCAMVFTFDIKGIIALSSLLTPIMIAGIILLSMLAFAFRQVGVFAPLNQVKGAYILSGFIYASYNLICGVGILSSLGKEVPNKKTAITAAVISAFVLTATAIFMWAAIKLYMSKIILGEVPMYTLALRQGKITAIIYGTVLYMAMLTTALSNGYCVLGIVLNNTKIKKWAAILMLCLLSLPISLFKFSDMVKNVYTTFGFAGFIIIFLVLKDGFLMLKEHIIQKRLKK